MRDLNIFGNDIDARKICYVSPIIEEDFYLERVAFENEHGKICFFNISFIGGSSLRIQLGVTNTLRYDGWRWEPRLLKEDKTPRMTFDDEFNQAYENLKECRWLTVTAMKKA